MPARPEMQAVFKELRDILKEFERQLVVQTDKPDGYSLNTAQCDKNNKPMCFGATHLRKSYVSYYLMPVYMFPELLKGISPELKARMHGKSCFNFKTLDASPFRELARLTKQGFDRFKKAGLI